MNDPTPSEFLLATARADAGQRRLAGAVLLLSVGLFLVIAPFAREPLGRSDLFLPIYQTALVAILALTALLMFGEFLAVKARALLLLAGGYLYSVVMSVAHLFSFPGLFAPAGVIGGGPQTTAWLYFLWHGGFFLFVIGYALVREGRLDALPGDAPAGRHVLATFAAALSGAGVLVLFATAGHDRLPAIMQGDRDAPAKLIVALATWLIGLLALFLLWRRHRHRLLDLWLMLAGVAWILDTALASVLNQARYDVGWYAGRIFGLFAVGFILVQLLIKRFELFNRLADHYGRLRGEYVDRLEKDAAALRESEARFRSTFEQAAVGIAHVAPDGRWLRTNARLCAITGYSREELQTMTFQQITHPDDLEVDLTHVGQVLSGRIATYAMEKRYLRKDGGTVWVNLTVSLARRADGAPDYFISVVEDIAARKRAEEELQRLHREVDELMRVQVASLTASALAHELNQPLHAVSTYAAAALRMLESGDWKPDKLRHALESGAEQAQRAGHVIGELLAFLTQKEATHEALDLNELVRRVLGQVRSQHVGRVRIKERLTPQPASVSANQVQIEKVLRNLIDNGVEAMRNAGVADIEVTVRSTVDGRMAHVSVSDRGPGIEAHRLRAIFDPFFTTKPSGLGIGLTISRTIVESHGGQLWAESDSGCGAIFHFTLPFAT